MIAARGNFMRQSSSRSSRRSAISDCRHGRQEVTPVSPCDVAPLAGYAVSYHRTCSGSSPRVWRRNAALSLWALFSLLHQLATLDRNALGPCLTIKTRISYEYGGYQSNISATPPPPGSGEAGALHVWNQPSMPGAGRTTAALAASIHVDIALCFWWSTHRSTRRMQMLFRCDFPGFSSFSCKSGTTGSVLDA